MSELTIHHVSAIENGKWVSHTLEDGEKYQAKIMIIKYIPFPTRSPERTETFKIVLFRDKRKK